MFTVQKGRVLVVSKGMGEAGGGKIEIFTDDQVAMYIRPMQSAIIAGTDNSEDRSRGMKQSALIKTHARMILEGASQKVVEVRGKQNRTILSILKGAFGPNISGWTVKDGDMDKIKEFANIMLKEIQSSENGKKKPDIAANDEEVKLMA